jgi:hypothetical protein
MTKRKLLLLVLKTTLTVLAIMLALGASYPWLPASVRAAIKLPPPFDFNDSFYTKNGICITPDANLGCAVGINTSLGADSRVGFFPGTDTGPEFGTNPPTFGGAYNWIVDTSNSDPTRGGTNGGIRVTQTTGGFDKDGNLIYYSIMAPLPDDRFFTSTNDNGAGARAHTLANSFRAFIFPKQRFGKQGNMMVFDSCPVGTQPGTPAAATCVVLNPPPGNRRQDNLFETKNQYFCGNLLGLWLIEMVVFTPASQTPAGQQALAPLVAQNGATLDGTPVLKTLDQINQLVNAGFVELRELPATPHPGPGDPRYVV